MERLAVSATHLNFDAHTPEEDIAAFVDAIKRSPERRGSLVELLSERHPLYSGRGANASMRIRGYILASFETVGLPGAALPYVLEELQTGREAYLVAAAAKAIRGLADPPDEAARYLLKAVDNVTYVDDVVTFDEYRPTWPLLNSTTALAEICLTLALFGRRAATALPQLVTMRDDAASFSEATRASVARAIDSISRAQDEPTDGSSATTCACCAPQVVEIERSRIESVGRNNAAVPMDVEFEDQEERRLTYGDFFADKPSVAAFFYTRCTNPNKCSLTITKLGRLQCAIADAGMKGHIRTAAITYDPAFDLPSRLRAYAKNRGMSFGHDDRALRTTAGFPALSDYFDLGVNFGQAVVNRHRIELFVLDQRGRIAERFTRLQWDVTDVLKAAAAQT